MFSFGQDLSTSFQTAAQSNILLLQQRKLCVCWEEGRPAPPGKCISTSLLWEAQPGIFAAPELELTAQNTGCFHSASPRCCLSLPICPWVLPKKQSGSYLGERKPEYMSIAETLVTPHEIHHA